MIKRMMFWAALASMTGATASIAGAAPDEPFPRRPALDSAALKAMPPSLAKAVYADIGHSARIVASDAAAFDRFGFSVAIDGNTAVVGAYLADTSTPSVLEDTGAAYVYDRSGNTWTQTAKLIEPASALKIGGESFGRSVAISGETIAVGSPFSDKNASTVDSGAVFVFVRSSGVWSQQAKLVGTETVASDKFGQSVSLDTDTLLVGSPNATAGAALRGGAIYAFTRAGAVWTQQARLIASDPQTDAQFGESVDVSADSAVAGAPLFDTSFDVSGIDSGAAYVYSRSAGVWSAPTKLRAASPTDDGRFGHSVAVHSGTVVVGEHFRNGARGAAHVFTGSGASWSLQALLTASDAAAGDFFGHSVALLDDVAVIGAYGVNSSGTDRGTAYRFNRTGSAWSEVDKYFASDAADNDRFGFGVALTASGAIVGAPEDDVLAASDDAGSAYLFHLGTPTTTIQIVDPTSAKFGQTISLSAQVSGGTPTGNVEFRNGASVLATAALNGSFVAAANITPAVGAYSITANYVGDANHIGSSSAATAVTVSKADTSLALNTTGSPTDYGQTVTFTVPISVTAPGAGSPSGNIEFRDNGTLIATQPLIAGEATLSINSLPVNSGNPHPITATYTGSGNYNGSTIGPINHVVNRVQPTMQLNSSLDPSLLGQQLTISAVITGGIPTCFVDFEADNLGDGNPAFNIGGAAVSGGTAAITWTPPAVGDYAITATCGGDANQFATNGSGLTQNVLPSADVSVTKSNGADSVQSGQDTTYIIVVTNPAGGADTDGLLVNDTLNPAQFDVPNADWSCAPAGICSPESGTGNIADLPLDLAAGSSVTITLTVPVLPEAESGVSNTVSLTLPNGVGDPNPANNTATDSDRSGLFGDGFEDSGLPN